MAKPKKEPKLLYKYNKTDYFVSREWVGWYVLYACTEKFDMETMLKIVEEKAPKFMGKEGQVTASVARDGLGAITFTPVV